MLAELTDSFGIQLTIDQDPQQAGSSQNRPRGSALPPMDAPNASAVLDSASADAIRPPTRRGPDQGTTNGSFPSPASDELPQASMLADTVSLLQLDGSSIQGDEGFTVDKRRHSA